MDNFDGRRQISIHHLVDMPDLMRPHVVSRSWLPNPPCVLGSRGHGICPFHYIHAPSNTKENGSELTHKLAVKTFDSAVRTGFASQFWLVRHALLASSDKIGRTTKSIRVLFCANDRMSLPLWTNVGYIIVYGKPLLGISFRSNYVLIYVKKWEFGLWLQKASGSTIYRQDERKAWKF